MRRIIQSLVLCAMGCGVQDVGEPERTELRGRIDYRYATALDGESGWREIWLVSDDGSTRLQFAEDDAPDWLDSGDWVVADGVLTETGELADAVVTQDRIESGGMCSTTGEQKIAVVLVEAPGTTIPQSMTEIQSRYFDPVLKSLDGYWRDASYGATWATGGVFGPYTLDRYYDCSAESGLLRTKAMELAEADVYFPDYTRVSIVFTVPSGSSCSFAGMGTLSCEPLTAPIDGTFTASTTWINATNGWSLTNHDAGVSLLAHEMGHNLGMSHASQREFATEILGPPGEQGFIGEYGDPYSAVGPVGFNKLGHYAAPHKVTPLGWLAPAQVATVETAGVFLLTPMGDQTPGGLRALKVRRSISPETWVWVEWRQPIGAYESVLDSRGFNGALIHYNDAWTGSHTHLLDFTYDGGWANLPFDGSLAPGASWIDPHTTLRLAVETAGSNLQVTAGHLAASVSVPGTQFPKNTIVPITATVGAGAPVEGAAVTFTLKRGPTTTTHTATTGVDGTAVWNWLANPKGNYTVKVTAVDSGQTVDSPTISFKVI